MSGCQLALQKSSDLMASRIEAFLEKLIGSTLAEMSNLNFSSFNSALLGSRCPLPTLGGL